MTPNNFKNDFNDWITFCYDWIDDYYDFYDEYPMNPWNFHISILWLWDVDLLIMDEYYDIMLVVVELIESHYYSYLI